MVRARVTFLIRFVLLPSPSEQALSIRCETGGGSKRYVVSHVGIQHISLFVLTLLFPIAGPRPTPSKWVLYLTVRFGSNERSATFQQAIWSFGLMPKLSKTFSW